MVLVGHELLVFSLQSNVCKAHPGGPLTLLEPFVTIQGRYHGVLRVWNSQTSLLSFRSHNIWMSSQGHLADTRPFLEEHKKMEGQREGCLGVL